MKNTYYLQHSNLSNAMKKKVTLLFNGFKQLHASTIAVCILVSVSIVFLMGCDSDAINEEDDKLINESINETETLTSTAVQSSGTSATINWNDTKQTIKGFGASDAWLSDEIENHSKSGELMDRFFKSDDGNIGLSILRQRIDPKIRPNSNTWDWTNTKFKANAWTATQAKLRGVDKIWASCWTAPAWMKDNNKLTGGGYLKTTNFSDYATFLSEYVKRMKVQENVDYYGLSPQNEPGQKTWESMEWNSGKLKDFVADNLRARLNSAGLSSTKIFYPEETRWGDIDRSEWALSSSKVQNNVDIFCGHSYGTVNYDNYTNYGKPIWHTEYWTEFLPEVDGAISLGENIHKYFVNAKVEAFHYWWMVTAHPSKRNGLIRLDGTSGYTIYKNFYALGQFSKFIKPGWKRISVTNPSPFSSVFISAYKNNSNNKIVIVAVNNSSVSRTMDLNFNGFTSAVTPYRTSSSENLDKKSSLATSGSVIVSLPKKSITTYVGSATEGSMESVLPPTEVWLRLKNRATGKYAYLKADDNNRLRGVGQGTGDGSFWKFIGVGNEYFKIQNFVSNGFAYRKSNDSNRIRGNGAGTGGAAFWKPEVVNGEWFRLVNQSNGKYLRNVTSDSNRLRADNTSTGEDAQWKWEPLP